MKYIKLIFTFLGGNTIEVEEQCYTQISETVGDTISKVDRFRVKANGVYGAVLEVFRYASGKRLYMLNEKPCSEDLRLCEYSVAPTGYPSCDDVEADYFEFVEVGLLDGGAYGNALERSAELQEHKQIKELRRQARFYGYALIRLEEFDEGDVTTCECGSVHNINAPCTNCE